MAARRKASATPPAAAVRLDYDATKTTGRRRAPSTSVVAEHVMLPDSKRKKLLATVQDQQRNASAAAWMIRRHLDYVSKFRFQFRTGKDALDKVVNRLFHWHAQPRNFDIAARFGREEMFRMFEAEKVTAGDAAMIKLSGLMLQAIESDLIAYPKVGKYNPKTKRIDQIPKAVLDSVNKDTGVVMDPDRPGRVAQFCICSRGQDGKSVAFDHLEPAENVIFDAYWTRFSSQVRGVSPLSTAINSIQDVYEGVDFNLAKAKVHALFGIALMRDYAGANTPGEVAAEWGAASGVQGAEGEEAVTEPISAKLQEIKPNEMLMLDMDTRGRIETVESKTPSSEFREFQELVLRLAFLALDIPYSAFNSKATSFSGMIADQNLYEVSCRSKREKNSWKRREYSDWLLETVWNDPKLSAAWNLKQIANDAGITRLRELQEEVEWVPSGFPWLMKGQEIEGDTKAIAIGADNIIDSCTRRGSNFFENIDKQAEAEAYAKEKGVALVKGLPGQSVEQDMVDDGQEKEGEDE